MIADLWLDLRFALRGLRLRPGFSALVVLSLGLGIAANVAIFSLVNATFLRPLAVHAPEELALFATGWATGRPRGMGSRWIAVDGRMSLFSYPLYERLREQVEGLSVAAQDSFTEKVLLRRRGAALSDQQPAEGRAVSANYFELLGVPAQRGRLFEPDDDRAQNRSPVLVLSHRFWQRRFGGDPSIVGETLSLNGTPFTVVGIAPPEFGGISVGIREDFWVPLGMANSFSKGDIDVREHAMFWLQPFGRLKPGASLESAQASADVILKRYAAEDGSATTSLLPASTLDQDRSALRGYRIELSPGASGMSILRHNFREPLQVLMTGVGLLLLIVCLNVSHLLLARAASRQHEMSVRSALGATRGRLVRQLLTEGLLLAGLGAALGAWATHWLSESLTALASSGSGPFAFTLALGADERVIAFTLALCLGTALLLGLVPVGYALSGDLQQAMRAAAPSVTAAASRHRLAHALMVSQVGLSLVLLVSAGLLARSLSRLRDVDTGFDDEHVLLAELDVQQAGVAPERAAVLYEEIPRRLAAQPGVVAASLSHPTVLSGRLGWTVSFPGLDLPLTSLPFYRVTPGYFEALGLDVVRGRGFSPGDGPGGPLVALINQTLAAQVFGARDPLGQRIHINDRDVEIVGVVRDAHTRDIRLPMEGIFYLPVAQPHGIPANLSPRSLEVRGHGDPAQLAELVRRTVGEVQSGLMPTNVRPLSEQVERTLVKERLLALLASAFGLSALGLVALGLYGVISQWATQRTREMGIRLALGATPLGVVWLVLRQALSLLLVGLAFGAIGAFAASRVLGALLFRVEPFDLQILLGASLALTAVAAIAAYLPARRVARVDPVHALRCE